MTVPDCRLPHHLSGVFGSNFPGKATTALAFSRCENRRQRIHRLRRDRSSLLIHLRSEGSCFSGKLNRLELRA